MHYYFVRLSFPDEENKQMKTIGRTFFTTPDSLIREIITKYGYDADIISVTKID